MYDIAHVNADVEGAIHGTTTNQIKNLFGIYNRAARDVLADVDPAETKRIVPFVNAVYGQVYDYQCPADLKGDRIIDIFPQVNRTGVIQQKYNQAFDLEKGGEVGGGWNQWVWNGGDGLMTVLWNTGVKSLRLSVPVSPSYLLHDCDTINQNGTWITGGSAQALTVDNLNFVQGEGSLKFAMSTGALLLEDSGHLLLEDGGDMDLESGGAGPALIGFLENSTMEAVDLSQIEDEGALFCWAFIPSGASITSFNLRWGSSATEYWDNTVTANQDGTAFQTGWNLLRFDWSTATQTASPDASSVTYLRFTVNATGSLIYPLRLDVISAQLGTILDIEYYSKFLFRDGTTGAFKETVTSDSDQINLDVDSYQLFFNKVMVLVGQQLQGVDASFHDGPFFQGEYDKSLARYKAKYKSEIQAPQSNYYQQATPGYDQYYGRRIGR